MEIRGLALHRQGDQMITRRNLEPSIRLDIRSEHGSPEGGIILRIQGKSNPALLPAVDLDLGLAWDRDKSTPAGAEFEIRPFHGQRSVIRTFDPQAQEIGRRVGQLRAWSVTSWPAIVPSADKETDLKL